MRLDEIVKVLKRQPFEPFRVHMSDGSSYPVVHPDQIIVTPRAAHIGLPRNGEERVAQEVVICDLIHVTRLGPISRGGRRARVK